MMDEVGSTREMVEVSSPSVMSSSGKGSTVGMLDLDWLQSVR